LLRVLRKDSTDTQARLTLGQCYRLQGREKEADAAFAEFERNKELLHRASKLLQEDAERPTGNADELFEIASMFIRTDQSRLAIYWLDQALRRDSAHKPTHKALAELFEKEGKRENAAYHRRLAGDDRP
jgi:thioredoxin-like negative regulator of GroEL